MREKGKLRSIGTRRARGKLRLAVEAMLGKDQHGTKFVRVFPHEASVVHCFGVCLRVADAAEMRNTSCFGRYVFDL